MPPEPHSLTAPEVLERIRNIYTGASPKALLFQYAILAGVELWLLYSVIKSRGEEVHVNSHARLRVGVLFMAGLSLAYYRVFIWLQPSGGVFSYVGYYAGMLLLLLVLPIIQQMVLMIINRIGKAPILWDKVRPELAGNDCHYSVIRRFAPFVLLWFLLAPAVILTAPVPHVFQYVAGAAWLILMAVTLAR